jgi:hypothetical protein
MRLPPPSARNAPPAPSTASAMGPLKHAACPTASYVAATPQPASVDTLPLVPTARTRWLLKSATSRGAAPTPLPLRAATPRGELKVADAPGPSAHPAAPLPAVASSAGPGYSEKRNTLLPPASLTQNAFCGVDAGAATASTATLHGADRAGPPGKKEDSALPFANATRTAGAPVSATMYASGARA